MSRSTIITKKIPGQPVANAANEYQPLSNEQIEIKLKLTDEQIWILDLVAKKHNICHNRAFQRIWNAAFRLIKYHIDLDSLINTTEI